MKTNQGITYIAIQTSGNLCYVNNPGVCIITSCKIHLRCEAVAISYEKKKYVCIWAFHTNMSIATGRFIYLGCDTTSAFYGKGKKKTWKLMVEKKMFDGFRQLRIMLFSITRNIPALREIRVCVIWSRWN